MADTQYTVEIAVKAATDQAQKQMAQFLEQYSKNTKEAGNQTTKLWQSTKQLGHALANDVVRGMKLVASVIGVGVGVGAAVGGTLVGGLVLLAKSAVSARMELEKIGGGVGTLSKAIGVAQDSYKAFMMTLIDDKTAKTLAETIERISGAFREWADSPAGQMFMDKFREALTTAAASVEKIAKAWGPAFGAVVTQLVSDIGDFAKMFDPGATGDKAILANTRSLMGAYENMKTWVVAIVMETGKWIQGIEKILSITGKGNDKKVIAVANQMAAEGSTGGGWTGVAQHYATSIENAVTGAAQSGASAGAMAGGGYIEGERKPYDDIPALLQAGEFVLSRRDVEMFGGPMGVEALIQYLSKQGGNGGTIVDRRSSLMPFSRGEEGGDVVDIMSGAWYESPNRKSVDRILGYINAMNRGSGNVGANSPLRFLASRFANAAMAGDFDGMGQAVATAKAQIQAIQNSGLNGAFAGQNLMTQGNTKSLVVDMEHIMRMIAELMYGKGKLARAIASGASANAGAGLAMQLGTGARQAMASSAAKRNAQMDQFMANNNEGWAQMMFGASRAARGGGGGGGDGVRQGDIDDQYFQMLLSSGAFNDESASGGPTVEEKFQMLQAMRNGAKAGAGDSWGGVYSPGLDEWLNQPFSPDTGPVEKYDMLSYGRGFGLGWGGIRGRNYSRGGLVRRYAGGGAVLPDVWSKGGSGGGGYREVAPAPRGPVAGRTYVDTHSGGGSGSGGGYSETAVQVNVGSVGAPGATTRQQAAAQARMLAHAIAREQGHAKGYYGKARL